MAEKGHSSRNGHQMQALMREAQSLQARIDRAVALSDQAADHAATVNGASWAPLRPATTLEPGGIKIPATQGDLEKTYGVSGTPITSGYLVDLGEYNAELMGRNAIPIYEKMRRSDAQVRATLMACKLPILSAAWEVAPAERDSRLRGNDSAQPRSGRSREGGNPVSSTGEGNATSAKTKEITEFVRENLFGGLEFKSSIGGWISQSWQSVIWNALLMLDFGCAIHEDVWIVDGERIRLRALPARLPVTFYRWHTEADGETLLALEQYGYRGNQFLNVLLPAGKICRFTYQQEGANFWGIALQRAMYPHWYVKSKLYRIDAIANERNALGIPVFRLSPGFAAEDKAAAYSFVTQLAAHEAAGLVEPPGEPRSGLRITGYEGNLRDVMPSIQHHNEMISRAALNTFMDLGQSAHGSRALGGTAADFFMLGLQSVADQIALDITKSTIRRLVSLNFGDDAPCPRLIPANVQARSVGEITADLVALAQQGLVVSEKNIRRVIRERFALPEESNEGIVAIRGESIEQGSQVVAGRGAGDIEG
ncbi:MAG: phage portal protein family protein [Terriglobia bacterium]